MQKYIYSFTEGSKELKNKLGGKGASLAEMTNLGFPVPPGMTITADVCTLYYENKEQLPRFLIAGIKEYLAKLEEKTDKQFGNPINPLLVSVRSGAASSMPGMMDTILNLGLNDEVVQGLAKAVGSERFAYDSYRRLVRMFGEVVYKISGREFEEILVQKKQEQGVKKDIELNVGSLKQVIDNYKKLIKIKTDTCFPQNPVEQLITAIEAVFGSWNNQRAIAYRESQGLDHDLGTAVNIQAMVFGNLGSRSGTGVLFTRNPATGEKKLYGEYLLNAQGEDVVGGTRTPKQIDSLKQDLPGVWTELKEVADKLENYYQDLQDIEFTIEQGQLYLLQTRTGKRTARADIKIAVDMVEEGLITEQEALMRIEPEQIEKLLHPQLDPEAELEVLAQGLAASPGAATGEVVFDPEQAQQWVKEGRQVILISPETSPEDIEGVLATEGVLTIRGGMTSHAAVVARGVGKPCICGCEEINLDLEQEMFTVAGQKFTTGDYITIDGTKGRVMAGQIDMVEPELGSKAEQLLSWADKYKTMQVMTNADNREDVAQAIDLGAAGIGLCRTEHMFRAEDRLEVVRDLILSEEKKEKKQALAKMKEFQQQDFRDLFMVLEGRSVTIRLLDAPLHEFLPPAEELTKEINKLTAEGKTKQADKKQIRLQKIKKLSESNPMLGFRGCRLGIMREDIYKMQVEAILEAAQGLLKKGIEIELKIMVPLISHVNEFKVVKQQIKEKAAAVLTENKIDFELGTMIELPRACVTADQIAKEADFFSFGTNDLTQTTFGFSRDDVESKFLTSYLKNKVLSQNPFVELDRAGVGRLIKFAARTGRKINSDLQVGICGEQGGNPASITFCQEADLDYISCSPYRIPIARLAAARANLLLTTGDEQVKAA